MLCLWKRESSALKPHDKVCLESVHLPECLVMMMILHMGLVQEKQVTYEDCFAKYWLCAIGQVFLIVFRILNTLALGSKIKNEIKSLRKKLYE